MTKSTPFFVWWFFPISGLEITDSNLTYLVDDASVVSKSFVAECLWVYSTNKIFPKSIAEDILLNDRVDSLVAIRRRYLGTFKEEKRNAEQRFEEILAALVLFSLVKHGYSSAYCSTDFLRVNHFGSVGLRENSHHGATTSELRSKVLYHRKLDSLTAKELDCKLAKSELSDILGVLLIPELITRKYQRLVKEPLVHNSVRRCIVLTAKRIMSALNTHSSSEVVAACITCFEILLSTTGVKDDDVQGRLEVLVGFSKSEIDRLYMARNEWVHRGVRCDDELERTALFFVVRTMQILLDLVFRLPVTISHGDILQWLDYHAFIRKRNNERPGRLEELANSLSMFDPFQIAESVRLSKLNADGGLMKTERSEKKPKRLRRRMYKERT